MRSGTQGRSMGSGSIKAGLIAIFAAAGGIGAAEETHVVQLGSMHEEGRANAFYRRAKIVDVELPACVDTTLAGVIHLDRAFTGVLEVELLYRPKEQVGFGGSPSGLVDTGRSATVSLHASSTGSFDFGQLEPADDVQCFAIELKGARSLDVDSWNRWKLAEACIPVCAGPPTPPPPDTPPPTVAAPTFYPPAGDRYVCGALPVELSEATAGADVYYTLDGSTPSSSSTLAVVNSSDGNRYIDVLYRGEGTTTTVKAIAIKDGISSNVVQVTYTLYQEPDPLMNCW